MEKLFVLARRKKYVQITKLKRIILVKAKRDVYYRIISLQSCMILKYELLRSKLAGYCDKKK